MVCQLKRRPRRGLAAMLAAAQDITSAHSLPVLAGSAVILNFSTFIFGTENLAQMPILSTNTDKKPTNSFQHEHILDFGCTKMRATYPDEANSHEARGPADFRLLDLRLVTSLLFWLYDWLMEASPADSTSLRFCSSCPAFRLSPVRSRLREEPRPARYDTPALPQKRDQGSGIWVWYR